MFNKFDVDFIVNNAIHEIANDNKENLTSQQMLDIMKVAIYESIQKYEETTLRELRRNITHP